MFLLCYIVFIQICILASVQLSHSVYAQKSLVVSQSIIRISQIEQDIITTKQSRYSSTCHWKTTHSYAWGSTLLQVVTYMTHIHYSRYCMQRTLTNKIDMMLLLQSYF